MLFCKISHSFWNALIGFVRIFSFLGLLLHTVCVQFILLFALLCLYGVDNDNGCNFCLLLYSIYLGSSIIALACSPPLVEQRLDVRTSVLAYN